VDPLAAFVELMGGPLPQVQLDRACLLVAAVLCPGEVDIDRELTRLDDLAAGVAAPSLEAVIRHLFVAEGFTGDRNHYYDVTNSLLPSVLDRRRGIPITLSILMIEVARRGGVHLVGIGLPGHFLVGDPSDADRFVDPFSGGVLLDREACRRLFEHLHRAEMPFVDSYLDPVGPMAIMARVLANLKQTTAARGERHQLVRVLRMRSAIPRIGPMTRAELADALVATGQFDEAAFEFEGLAEQSSSEDAELLRQAAARARARLN
jgi:regulator of sirC expression with transglutaminase-like and TPR domain